MNGLNGPHAKAWVAGIVGFLAPGVGVLLPQVAPGGDGIQTNEWLWAIGLCITFAAGGAVGVYKTKNQPAQP